jgi:hypothetical protein
VKNTYPFLCLLFCVLRFQATPVKIRNIVIEFFLYIPLRNGRFLAFMIELNW